MRVGVRAPVRRTSLATMVARADVEVSEEPNGGACGSLPGKSARDA